jgi:hypothetical protein
MKSIIAGLLITIAYFTLYLSTKGIAVTSDNYKQALSNADCDILSGSLIMISNYKNDPKWIGLEKVNAKLDLIKNYLS